MADINHSVLLTFAIENVKPAAAPVDGSQAQVAYAIVVGYSINDIWSDLTFVEPHESRDIANALNDISEDEFRRRCVEGSFLEKEIYRCPDDLDDNEIDETLEYFIRLKEFFIDAANNGNAVLRLIS